ncbi:PfkB family carbohydrate kinase, partial [Pseudomonas aeruginosa]|uniref:PfkB family carbohydrate kinase n=1 Tax=Pseudomonas aeruginosa TaxID=287 RepID=UPI0031B68606
PTQNELEILWGQPIKDDNDRIRAVNSLHQQGVKRIFVYLKDESVFCSDKDGEQFLLTAPAHTTVDSFGADDGFMAGPDGNQDGRCRTESQLYWLSP